VAVLESPSRFPANPSPPQFPKLPDRSWGVPAVVIVGVSEDPNAPPHRLVADIDPRPDFIGAVDYRFVPRRRDSRKWYHEGVYKYSEGEFLKNVRRTGADMKRVFVVSGFFEESLRPDNPLVRDLRKAAVVWIDCDLYSSTRTVLDFITPYLQYGTLLLFDDWFAFLADPNAGQQRAFREWLEKNPQLRAVELMRFGWCGNSFVIHITDGPKANSAVNIPAAR
jgi:hypothetical protein